MYLRLWEAICQALAAWLSASRNANQRTFFFRQPSLEVSWFLAVGSPPLSARPVAAGRGRARARRLGRRPPVTAGLAGGDVARRSELTY